MGLGRGSQAGRRGPGAEPPGPRAGPPTGPPGCASQCNRNFDASIRSGLDTRLFQGVSACAQYWMRDPASFPTVGLSNGLGFVINL
jgi:hypothetical protein